MFDLNILSLFTYHKPFLLRIVYMKINHNITQKITTSTTVTASVQQALKILQMTNVELSEYVQQEALENPFLVIASPSIEQPLPNPTMPDNSWPNQWETGDSLLKEDDRPSWENTLIQPDNINEYIISQINTNITDPKEYRLALILFGLLDERGFFTIDLKILGKHLNVSPHFIQKLLEKLKQLEPAGLFAANWKESVLLQLQDQGYNIDNYQIILESFQEILQGKLSNVEKATGLSSEDIYKALKQIKNINPYPLKFLLPNETIQVRIPDVIVTKDPIKGWGVSLNHETLPKVLADREYFQEVKTLCSLDAEKTFIRDSFQKATWLVKAMDQRYQNILKVGHALLKRQYNFLEHGPKLLSPMTLKDIATDIGIHESTVSRAISQKYIQTPQGIYPLKYFFTQAINGSFQEYSAESIRNQIRQFIQNETVFLSDDKITEMLNHLGVDIARRTVTKYRESMSIPSSSERRRIKKIISS
jgi:RNA polymerase sigma-54 factor